MLNADGTTVGAEGRRERFAVVITGTEFSFPDGTGAAARVRAIASGLRRLGATVRVLCLKPSENVATGNRNPEVRGVWEGVEFEYTGGQRLAARTRLGALFLYLKGLWRATLTIARLRREMPLAAILLWNPKSPINVIVFWLVGRWTGATLIGDESEFPFVYSRQSLPVRTVRWFNDHLTYRLLDGMVVISTYLETYFAPRLNRRANCLLVPALVDTSLFQEKLAVKADGGRSVVFCGNLRHEGEVDELLRTFAIACDGLPHWKLTIVGDLLDSRGMGRLDEISRSLGIEGRVRFHGAQGWREIPAVLAGGNIMALPRAAGRFSDAGFPTKLAEYLASGKPTVVTSVGDISRYIEDRVSGFLVPPGDAQAFARTLRWVMMNPENALAVGRAGRTVAQVRFDHIVHARRILDFISELRGTSTKRDGPRGEACRPSLDAK